jgi:hypothetical protein
MTKQQRNEIYKDALHLLENHPTARKLGICIGICTSLWWAIDRYELNKRKLIVLVSKTDFPEFYLFLPTSMSQLNYYQPFWLDPRDRATRAIILEFCIVMTD